MTLQPLVLSPLRDHPSSPLLSLLLQNKEGLVSLLGYLAIHIFGLSLGTVVLPYSPSFYRKHQIALEVFQRTGNKPLYFDIGTTDEGGSGIETRYRQTDKTALEVASYSMVWWFLVSVVRFYEAYVSVGGSGVSRRMVSLYNLNVSLTD